MGKTQFIKAVSITFGVLGATFVGIEFLKKSIQAEDINLTIKENNKTKYNKMKVAGISKYNSFEENKTLDRAYQSVASQIEAFIKRQKSKDINKTKLNETNISKSEINTTKTDQNLPDINITVVKKTQIKNVKPKNSAMDLPKLAIIMDDIGFYEEIQRIKKIPFAITPSIFPPNEHYQGTPDIAKEFKHYMVHFPMEAYKYKNIKEEAIKVSDKLEVIENKVKLMQENFPNAIAINNHTGSKYTCNFDAMEQFFSVLNRYDINFIDSRTSSGSQCQEVGKLLNKKVLQRDVFLDNRADIIYIKNQLKEAVKLAKKNGKAIAICHPKDMTFEALMSCESILEGVEVVYVNELL